MTFKLYTEKIKKKKNWNLFDSETLDERIIKIPSENPCQFKNVKKLLRKRPEDQNVYPEVKQHKL